MCANIKTPYLVIPAKGSPPYNNDTSADPEVREDERGNIVTLPSDSSTGLNWGTPAV